MSAQERLDLLTTGIDPEEPGAARPVRAALETAAGLLPPAPALTELTAVNPLAGFDELDVEQAAAEAARLLGAETYLPVAAYREAWHEGRIGPDDLRGALDELAPGLLERVGADLDPVEVLVADLLSAPDEPPVGPRPMTPAHWWDAAHGTTVAAEVDRRAAQWTGLALDATEVRWRGPVARDGLFPAWWAATVRDRSLPRAARRRVELLRGDPLAAADEALVRLGVAEELTGLVVVGEVLAQPGWAARLAWEAERRGPGDAVGVLGELVALRVGLELALLPPGAASAGPPAVPAPPDEAARPDRVRRQLTGGPVPEQAIRDVLDAVAPGRRRELWHLAYEMGPRRRLVAALDVAPADPSGPAGVPDESPRARPAAQVVCCIDVRSEALRRHLEALGDYRTIGAAGFFGVAMRWRRLGAVDGEASCPVVAVPTLDLSEAAPSGGVPRRRRSLGGAVAAARHAAKGTLSPYTFAEASGWVAGPVAAVRTLAPGLVADASRLRPPALPVDLEGVPLADLVALARGSLTTMGLVDGFAPVVVFCGHGSTTSANPHEASLRCGACSGRDGVDNARALAAVLNDPRVRAELAGEGVAIDGDTIFVAGRHDTTTDVVTLVDADEWPERAEELGALAADLRRAGEAVATERTRRLPGVRRPGPRAARRRAGDWAEPTPEWGLAGNMAFVIGPRRWTSGLELGPRAFLHDYDRDRDADATILAGILAGPALVTQWINAGYHLGVTAPEVLGAGSKAVHDPVGTAGVLTRPGGDLRLGPARQSVAADAPVHEPLRLLCVVDAPPARVDVALAEASRVRRLVENRWMALVALGEDGTWYRRHAGGWSRWNPEGTDPAPGQGVAAVHEAGRQ